ncbi:hypothetical protein P7C70_g7663, partial [Phenoliferia sp. Uapishka_3]
MIILGAPVSLPFLFPNPTTRPTRANQSIDGSNLKGAAHYAGATMKTPKGDVVPILVTLAGRTSEEIFPKLEKLVEERFPGLERRR